MSKPDRPVLPTELSENAYYHPPFLFETHWGHELERGGMQSTSHSTSAGQSLSDRSIALSVAPPLRLVLWRYLFSVRVLSPWDVAPTFLSAGWEAFQPPVTRQEYLPTCRLESRRYEPSGRSTHTLDIAAIPRRGLWKEALTRLSAVHPPRGDWKNSGKKICSFVPMAHTDGGVCRYL